VREQTNQDSTAETPTYSPVTLLSILGNNSIALPLCPSFPTVELRYILNDSQSTLLLSSEKFRLKSEEVVKEGLENAPFLQCLEKRLGGRTDVAPVNLDGLGSGQGGMMLYTSGTTNRPVRLSVRPPLELVLIVRRKECFCPSRF
jgi:acyl-CoA synthetase (AMP-forming)/AMP-acid ligase II